MPPKNLSFESGSCFPNSRNIHSSENGRLFLNVRFREAISENVFLLDGWLASSPLTRVICNMYCFLYNLLSSKPRLSEVSLYSNVLLPFTTFFYKVFFTTFRIEYFRRMSKIMSQKRNAHSRLNILIFVKEYNNIWF